MSTKELKIENAVIEDYSLGYEDHGILTMFIHCRFDGGGCGFGGYALDSYDKAQERRVGTAFGSDFIIQCLNVVGVQDIKQLKGSHIRVAHEGLGGGIRKIGHIIEDRWFDPKELAAKHTEQETTK